MKLIKYTWLSAAILTVAACDSGSSSSAVAPPPATPAPIPGSFEISATNLTNAQPLSPLALVVHNADYTAFTVGTAASVPLENLAEAGNNAQFLQDANGKTGVTVAATGTGPIGPGGGEVIRFTVQNAALATSQVSFITMLVNTNDAFTGLNGVSIGAMAVGDELSFRTPAYDAGTEVDDELAANIPGPAGGGEGFNAARDDNADQVTMHPGVISQNDGLATSQLTEAHRFDNPVMQVTIRRIAP